jgi:hypothetical protein
MPPAPRSSLFAPTRQDDGSTHAQRQAIGYLGLSLPVLVWLVSGWRTTGGEPGWIPLHSVSEYYHSGAVAIFTGVLAALAVFLFTYRGYDNAGQRLDRAAGKVACVAALGVSFFPTAAVDPFTAPRWWAGWMDTAHLASASVLFGSFIFYSLVLFPRSAAAPEARSVGKRRRNGVYRACGWGMAACMAWVLVAQRLGASIFWPEAVALALFAISWLTKGRAVETLQRLGARLTRAEGQAEPAPPAAP